VCQLLVLGTSNYVVAAALASRAECHVPQNVDFTANHWSGQMLLDLLAGCSLCCISI